MPKPRRYRPLTEHHVRRLREGLAQAGAPRLFWPGLQRLVAQIAAEIAEDTATRTAVEPWRGARAG